MPQLSVVAVELIYGLNLGYIARAMKNFGLHDLYLINIKPNIINESLRFCAHSCDLIQNSIKYNELDKAIEGTELVAGTTAINAKSHNNLLRNCISPLQFAELYHKRRCTAALILGRDSTGLTNRELNKCDILVNIPADPKYPTLNISHAASIIFYEIFGKGKAKYRSNITIRKEEIVRLCDMFSELSELVRIPLHRRRIAMRALRNILSRSSPTSRETSVLIGPLRRAIDLIKNAD